MKLDFECYESYVHSKSENDTRVIHNTYVNSLDSEGYKLVIQADLLKEKDRLLKKLSKKRDNEDILRFVLYSFDICHNLIYWEYVKKAKDVIEHAIEQKNSKLADFFYDFYMGNPGEQEFEKIKSYFGTHFDLIAYMFFSQNPDKFLPMSPMNFDWIFQELDIECAPLTRHVNWKTYCCYLTAINCVRKELCVKYPGEGNISPLDAHSFLWLHTYTEYSSYDIKCEKKYAVDFRQTEKYREAVSKARIGQGKYRKDMIDIWSGRCAVTDCAKTDILKASHAKPWGDIRTTADEAIDPFNGFLLSPDLDELFDQGYITFEDSGNIKISPKIKEMDYSKLGISADMKLRFVDEKHIPYLQFHRENKYQA